MKHTLLAGAALAGSLLFAPSAFAFTAQSMCPQWVQRGPHITAVCFSGHGNGLVPAAIDLRSCAPGADVGNYFGVLVCMNPTWPDYGPPPGPYGGWRRDEWRHGPRGWD